ncbi:hypothetical protein L1987_12542 [Smallanthus sonchifolius]|uniref:Uncharacterized protein n=1 Tax=Smallanthus sonchifolius TaxID=185202 RepID=A0ACB9JG85_9ASTR|nr:hypothetical protein L1987_12542 [Smallanthus sonchifolius]
MVALPFFRFVQPHIGEANPDILYANTVVMAAVHFFLPIINTLEGTTNVNLVTENDTTENIKDEADDELPQEFKILKDYEARRSIHGCSTSSRHQDNLIPIGF